MMYPYINIEQTFELIISILFVGGVIVGLLCCIGWLLTEILEEIHRQYP